MQKILFCLFVFIGFASAQEAFYKLPSHLVQLSPGAVSLQVNQQNVTYVEGIGWDTPSNLPFPLIVGNEVYGNAALLEALGLSMARLNGVRFGGSGTVRIVFDIEGLGKASLEPLTRQGRLAEGEVLSLGLPSLLLPLELPDPYRGIDLDVFTEANNTQVQLSTNAAHYQVFALDNPTRLVIDVTQLSVAEVEEENKLLRPGVSYQRFAFNTAIGSSGVHVLEIAPNAGEFRVVGANAQPAKTSVLASGAFAAINAGYFDTQTFEAIGLLKVDYGLSSLPYLQRASIGFGLEQPVIGRVEAKANVRINGQLYETNGPLFQDRLEVFTRAGQWAGQADKGVITVASGRVIENKIGPRKVPIGGFALVYEPDIRELALVNDGDFAALDVKFSPQSFEQVRYAVEAGPLLVDKGQVAFRPDLETFRRGERILDEYTQQAAIGIKADGTVLFVTADNMIAQEMVPLMLSLDAYSAMRLDSGGSTTLVIEGKAVNRSKERNIVSAIVFIPYAP